MRCYLSSIASLVGLVFLCAQTPIILEAGTVSHNNINGFIDNNYPTNIEDCTSIVYEVNYSFSLPWLGADNMDHNLECIPDCAGDPNNSLVGGCDECWDFMWIKSVLDGNIVNADTLGLSTNLSQSGTYSFGPICTDGATSASIEIRNQNFFTNETNSFSNVTILCWEAKPTATTNSPICAGSNLDLNGQADNITDVDSWMWTNSGAGVIDNDSNPNTFATNAEDGETYTLTTTDTSGGSCTSSVSVTASAMATFTASVSPAGSTLCPGDCTDIMIQITGGVAPYQVEFSFQGFPVVVPGIDIDETFTICYGNTGLPDIDNSTDPITITIPPLPIINIDVTEISDDSGCTVTNVGSISISLGPVPDVTQPIQQDECIEIDGTIDLTEYDDIINGGDNSLDVIYYETADSNDEISDPAQWMIGTNMVCARTFNGTCFSDFVCFGFNLSQQPVIENIVPIIECSDDLFVLPPVGMVADITPPGSFTGYFSDAAGTDGPLSVIPNTATEVFIIAEATAPCITVTESVPLDLTPNPIINFPGDLLGGCGSIELPEPDGINIISYEYNTDENGQGTSFIGGDMIESTDNISVIYLIAMSDNGCTDVLEILLDITNSVDYMADIPMSICDSLILPAITPATPTVAYYPMTGGAGTPIPPGTILQAPLTQTLFLFDPNQDPACAAEVPVTISINVSPTTDLPADTVGCEFYVLDSIRGTVASPDYTFLPISFPDSYREVGDTIRNSTLIYILDTIGSCTLYDSLFINITPPPFVGIDTTVVACEGYSSTELNLVELIGNPDPNGEWSYPTVPDFMPVDPENIDISIFPIGSYDFTYAIEDIVCGIRTATINLIIEERPYAGEDTMLETCNPDMLDFMALISDPATGERPEEGGFWFQVPMDTFDLVDSTQVDLSSLPVGQYIFIYSIPADAQSLCEGDTASLFIDIQNGPNAGDDAATTACSGSIVNIRQLLSSDADGGGMFFPDGFFLSGEEWNTTGSATNQTYNVQYIIESTSQGCPNDTAFIEIFLSDDISAGTPATVNPVCSGTSVNLTEYLEDESPGGSFVLTQDLTTIVDDPLIAMTDIDISYIVMDVGTCPGDTSSFSVAVVPAPTIDFVLNDDQLCSGSGDCIEFTVTSTEDGPITVNVSGDAPNESTDILIDIQGGTSILYTFCATDTFEEGADGLFQLSNESTTYAISSVNFNSINCGDINPMISETISMNQSFNISIDTTICAGDSILFGGVFYSSDVTFNGMTTMGCDSITEIIINNFPEAVLDIDGVFCTGTPINVFGNIITRDTTATYIEEGASFLGCDSIINVNVLFQDVAIGVLDSVICDGMPVMVGNEIFDENRTMDDVLIPSGSVAGCDSLVMVSLTYAMPSAETIIGDVCSGDAPIDVNGTFYGPNLLSGIETLLNAAGCDSTITIDLTLVPAIMTLRDDRVCSDFSEVIGSNTYDINLQSGIEELTTASGCDSIINVNLTFLLDVEITRDEQVCEDFSELIGTSTYDSNNRNGTERLTTVDGCDSTIFVNLDFVQSIEVTLDDVFCETDSMIINGTTYNISSPSGIDTLTSVAGCDSILNIDFTFEMTSAIITTSGECTDANAGELIVSDINGLSLPIMVSIDGGTAQAFSSLPATVVLANGTYDVSIDDGNCIYEETVIVEAGTGINAEIQSTVISATENQLLLITDITPQNISWSSDVSGPLFSCLDCIDPVVQSAVSYTATVTFTDENGCDYTEDIFIEATPVVVGQVYVPNIFNPNLTGQDRFYIQTSNSEPPILIDEMQVFDRWGNMVFESTNFLSNDPDVGWDGTKDDQILEQGVYVYFIKYNDGTRDNLRSGTITLIR
jgi:gliding motility-associated-like protein